MADAGTLKALNGIQKELHELNTTLRRRIIKIERIEANENDEDAEAEGSDTNDDQ